MLHDLYIFFKNSNKEEFKEPDYDFDTNTNEQVNETINKEISEDEILKVVKTLKQNKSPGIDGVLNEHIKSTVNIMLPIYVKLFNIVFDTGVILESWLTGNILPIYRNKGDTQNPENYRPITLFSCLGKVFTAIINNRLKDYSNDKHILSDVQAGFRKGFSTSDNMFIINALIDILKSRNKKLFCVFFYFQLAFDTVWRSGLWHKLQTYNINGKRLNLIKNMYVNIKSRIKNKDGVSPFFECCTGVRQGENLSPFLFSIFLNDLEHYFNSEHVPGIDCEINYENKYVFFKIFALLYADDTVIFGEDATHLQHALNVFETYCKTWKLKVNVSKTKIVIFGRGRPNENLHLFFENNEIIIVSEYKYLGIILSRSGSFRSNKKYIAEQANKALFTLFKQKLDL